MSKHISDQPRESAGAKMREFATRDRESGLHPAIRALHARPSERDETSRVSEYTRIERGHDD